VTFSTVSWLIVHGHPLYTDLAAAERYSLQHGPAIYLIVGSIMKMLGPGYITAKLATVAAFLIVILISWIWFSKCLSRHLAFILLGLESWVLLHWPYAYLVRPDAIMLLCVIVSMYIVTTRQNRWLLILGTAIPLGIMVNLKIHGLFYFVPILAIVYQQIGLRSILLIGGLSLLMGIAPFLLPQISGTNYSVWLVESIHHGFKWQNFIAKIVLGFVLFLIPVATGIVFGVDLGAFYRRNRLLILTLLVSSIIPAIVGSKAGSGTNHLIPFIPILMYVMILLIADIKKRCHPLPEVVRTRLAVCLGRAILIVIAILITVSGFNGEKRIFKHFASDRTAIFKEIQSIEALYTGKTLAIGYGEKASDLLYRDFIPLPVFHGNPYLVDSVALGDMNSAGVAMPAATIRKLADGAIVVWLIPAGDSPFADGIFDESFRQAFFVNYRLAARTEHFDVWIHRNIAR